MHDPKVLEHFGCTQDRIRQIFTSKTISPDTIPETSVANTTPEKAPRTDSEIKKRFENRIRSRLLDGIGENIASSRPNQAVDLAWDSPPIQKETIPLMLWAQGKIDRERLKTELTSALGVEGATRFYQKQPQDGKLMDNAVRITDFSVDLGKSYVTRRHAAMDALWANLWPLYKYDPRGVDDVTELRADALTQRVDIMSDDYNYRHFGSQCRRYMLLYGWSMPFVRAAWDRQISWRFKPTNTGEPGTEVESYVTREGVDFVLPHPSRIFNDLSAPLANINTDTGPRWVGYWDITLYSTLLSPDTNYFNLQETFISDGYIELATKFSSFFGYYFNPTVLQFPTLTEDMTLVNDRSARVGRYTSQGGDQGVLLTQYFEKINPKIEGIGEYDADVWIRLVVAGDSTVIGGEFLPSLPGAYGAVNWNDSRMVNQSMGMALLGYQDGASNIISHMNMQLRSSLVQLWLIDKDSVDADTIELFKKNATNRDWWVDPKTMVYSATKLRELGIMDPSSAFKIIQPQVQNAVEVGLKMLGELLNLADRLLVLSPNELGQPNPREVSAREVSEVSTSVQSIYAFINQGPREQVATMKRIIYESLIGCATQSFRVPILKRYSVDVIKRAGFRVPDDVKLPVRKDKSGQVIPPEDDIIPINTPIMGNLRDLVYDYYFDSRDGSERVVNTQGAQVTLQLLDNLLKIPGMAEKMGARSIMEAANVVIRMSGAPWNFQFQVPVGADDAMPPTDDPQMQKILQGLQANQQQVAQIQQVLAQVLHVPPSAFQPQGAAPGGPPGAAPAGPPPGAPPGPPAAAPAPPGGAGPSPATTLAEPTQNAA